jgi:hypothetical protein
VKVITLEPGQAIAVDREETEWQFTNPGRYTWKLILDTLIIKREKS